MTEDNLERITLFENATEPAEIVNAVTDWLDEISRSKRGEIRQLTY